MRQLQGMDASFVALETRNSPMHIGSLLIYNPRTAPGGFVRFKDVLSFFKTVPGIARLCAVETGRGIAGAGGSRPIAYWRYDTPLKNVARGHLRT